MFRRRLESLVKSILRSLIDRLLHVDRTPATRAPASVPPRGNPRPKPVKKPAPGSRRLTAATSYEGTVWIPRILWALEQARAGNAGAKSAADLARILAEDAKLKVAPNNIARAFRDLKAKPYAKGLWNTRDKKYTITKAGQTLLAKVL